MGEKDYKMVSDGFTNPDDYREWLCIRYGIEDKSLVNNKNSNKNIKSEISEEQFKEWQRLYTQGVWIDQMETPYGKSEIVRINVKDFMEKNIIPSNGVIIFQIKKSKKGNLYPANFRG